MSLILLRLRQLYCNIRGQSRFSLDLTALKIPIGTGHAGWVQCLCPAVLMEGIAHLKEISRYGWTSVNSTAILCMAGHSLLMCGLQIFPPKLASTSGLYPQLPAKISAFAINHSINDFANNTNVFPIHSCYSGKMPPRAKSIR